MSLFYPQANGAIERWNRILKETLLTAEQERKSWKPFIQKFLLIYCVTPQSTTEVSPHELMFNRKMRTKVNIGPASKSTPLLEKQLRNSVTAKQNASKAYTDVKRGAQVPRIKEGTLVRVRKPFHVKKGLSKFHVPARVMEKAGAGSFVLKDGHTLNTSHLSLVPDSAKNIITGTTAASAPEPELAKPPDDIMHRSNSIRKNPAWLDDFEH